MQTKLHNYIFLFILIIIVVAIVIFIKSFFSSFQTIKTIEKLTSYEDFNLYCMDVKYNYNIDNLIKHEKIDDQAMVDMIIKESMPLLPVHIKAPNFGCSVFCITDTDGDVLMGRNYDFRNDTSAMLVHCAPEGGYESVAFAALDNVSANTPEAGLKQKLAAMAAPFVCLDGVNEKGVSIAVLTLDSKPTIQETGKPKIFTSLAIRLVLDRAATTQEAVDLLRGYDMYASAGRDYHFYIADASGDARVVEYDCNSTTRKLVDTPSRAATNFFVMYIDKVLPNQKNGIYGHGKERYDRIEKILTTNEGCHSKDIAWDALRAVRQLPNPESVTSNTQWSIVFNNTKRTADVVIRRHWGDVASYNLTDNTLRTRTTEAD